MSTKAYSREQPLNALIFVALVIATLITCFNFPGDRRKIARAEIEVGRHQAILREAQADLQANEKVLGENQKLFESLK